MLVNKLFKDYKIILAFQIDLFIKHDIKHK